MTDTLDTILGSIPALVPSSKPIMLSSIPRNRNHASLPIVNAFISPVPSANESAPPSMDETAQSSENLPKANACIPSSPPERLPALPVANATIPKKQVTQGVIISRELPPNAPKLDGISRQDEKRASSGREMIPPNAPTSVNAKALYEANARPAPSLETSTAPQNDRGRSFPLRDANDIVLKKNDGDAMSPRHAVGRIHKKKKNDVVHDDFKTRDDEVCTCIISPTAFYAKDDLSVSPVKSDDRDECHCECTTKFRYSWLLSIFKQSLMLSRTYTLVSTRSHQSLVIFIRNGLVSWIEILPDKSFPDARQFLSLMALDDDPLRHHLIQALPNYATMSEVFSACNAETEARHIVENQIARLLPSMRLFEEAPVTLYDDMPKPWQSLRDHRPCVDIPFCPLLFEDLRANAESFIPPEAFSRVHFAMRPYRTPLNAYIQLNADENSLLTAIRMPRTIAELKLTGLKQIADTLYRLLLFEFADYVR